MKITDGFTMADSRNLPKVDYMMLLQYMRENETYNVAEIRGAKVLMSSRDAYVETAIGFVEIKRENPICYVKGKVTPEHKVRCKMYTVLAIINEVDETITDVQCEDCAASEGGCKHAICFIMWLIKRSDEPSSTSTCCYWARPKLSEAVTQNRCILAKELGKRKRHGSVTMLPPALRLPMYMTACKMRKMTDSLIINHKNKEQDMDDYSIYQIMLEFITKQSENMQDFKNLKMFADNIITTTIKNKIEEKTRAQAECSLWHTLKQGRISASKIHEVSTCKTDGVLVKTILGGYKVPETKAIRRGKALEKVVIKEIENEMKIKINQCGFMLVTPFIGASPDGVCEDGFTVEIKCPLKEKSMKTYIKDSTLSSKWKAQTQLQMHAMKKKKALFCIADPKFEENKKINYYWQYYDRLYVEKLILEAELFWETYLYQKIFNIVKS